MSDEPRTVRLVLDTTAITAWTRGSVAVGETLIEIDEEHGAVIIPLACLVEAAHATALLERDRLDLLIGHQATFLISDNPVDWLALTELRTLIGRADYASAAMAALDCDVDVMTADPRWYSSVNGGQNVLLIEDD